MTSAFRRAAGLTRRTQAILGSLLLFLASIGLALARDAAPAVSHERPWEIPSNHKIRELLAERMQYNGVGIVVGVIEPAGRRVIAYGKSGAADARPLDGDTVFQIGSITKVFTTLLLADMARRGEVRLEDPASKYLPPGATLPELGRPITLLDLATHRSSLPSMPTNFPLQGSPDPYQAYSVAELHQFLSNHRLSREPGVKAEYSNVGVALLGRLLAQRAGVEYEALLKARVLKPLGMHSTAITLTPDQSKRLAAGHDRYLDPVRTWNLLTLPASGSLRSTANDMLALLAAHLGYQDTPLKSAMEYQRTVRHPAQPSQALGWGVRNPGADEVFGHAGGKEGYRSGVVFDMKSRTGVVVLANSRSDDAPHTIALYLLLGRPLSPAPSAPTKPKAVTLEHGLLDAYAGLYRLETDVILAVARKNEHLLVDIRGDGILSFFPEAPRTFFANTTDAQLSFQMNDDGRITGLVLTQGGKEKSAQRL